MSEYETVDQLKEKLDSLRPLPPGVIKNLHEDLVLRWTYHSNAIEGNTLTLKETRVVLEGITIGGKTMREHCEAINHRQAIYYIEDMVKNNVPLSGSQITSLHHLILKNIDDANAGVYRKTNVIIFGAEHTPPDALQVQSEMDRFIHWHNNAAQKLHPVERAAMVHADFVKIHPFTDGNGRTARLLMNLELLKAGFPAAVLPVDVRLEYYESLDMAHTQQDYKPFINLIKKIVEQSFEPYWFALGVK
ncbi:MAG: Fic family protein [Spirochaetales bacterium]|nr:Fic family protein [Spirochaetales bacterium]